ASDDPKLTRLTPRSQSSASENVVPDSPITTLTGFGATARTTALIASRVVKPGAYRTSAPAAANASTRRIVSSRSGRPVIRFSARAVRMNGNGNARAAATAAATRSTASANG